MKFYFYYLIAFFLFGIFQKTHPMNDLTHNKKLPAPLIKYIGREAFWNCNSISEFKKTLDNFTLSNRHFFNFTSKIKDILTNRTIDAITKYKTFLKHIGFKDEDILLIAAQIGHLGLFTDYFNNQHSPLMTGENAGTYTSLQELLENVRDKKGNTVAHIAAKNKHKELWQYLLLMHVNHEIDLQGSRKLYNSINWLNHLEITHLLEQSNKYVNGLNNTKGYQPYKYAYKAFKSEAHEIKKEKRFAIFTYQNSINIELNAGTPLYKILTLLFREKPISQTLYHTIIKDLIKHGADVQNIGCKLDALQCCILGKDKRTFLYLNSLGYSVEKNYPNNKSLLFWIGELIAWGMYIDTENFFELLYEKLQSKINDQLTNDGQTLLHRAINGKNKDFIKKLLELGASNSLQDNQGNTPLHLGLIRKDITIDEEFCTFAKALMNQKVISTKNTQGKTPSDLILERLKTMTSSQEKEQVLLEQLFSYIKETYKIAHQEHNVTNNEQNDEQPTGNHNFNPIRNAQNQNLFETFEQKISSFFSPLGNFLDKYFRKK